MNDVHVEMSFFANKYNLIRFRLLFFFYVLILQLRLIETMPKEIAPLPEAERNCKPGFGG